MSDNVFPIDEASGFYGPFPAPAKLNLCLNITGRRPDGYHELQTVFQFLEQADRLWFRLRDDAAIRRVSDLPGVAPEDDLVVRAARLLARSGEAPGVDIRLEKHLPMGGGLGGGSSDAATTLRVLNRLWGLERPLAELGEAALSLGADVPIFVHGHAAWAEGVGERFSPVDPPQPWYLVVVPPVTVSTAEIFSDSELTRDAPPITISAFLRQGGENVCEPVVRRRFPQVDEVMNWLAQYAPARLTGTGAGVFAPFDSSEAAREVLKLLPGQWHGFVSHGCNTSPLVEVMSTQ